MKKIAYLLAFFVFLHLSFSEVKKEVVKDLLKKYEKALIRVKLVVKTKMSYSGKETLPNENKIETKGTFIDKNGLVLISLSTIDSSTFFNNKDVHVDVKFSDIKLILPTGKEIPAKIVLKDKDLDLGFIKPSEKIGEKICYIDLNNYEKVDIFDDILFLGRTGKYLKRVPFVISSKISAIIRKPRTFYITNDGEIGCPAFNEKGKFVGFFLAIPSLKFMGAILPSKYILEIKKQIK